MKTSTLIIEIIGGIIGLSVLYLFLVLLNIVPDAFGIKELINKIAY